MVNHINDETIQDFLDGNLNTAERAAIRQHLDLCEECRESLAAFQDIFNALEKDTDFVLSKNFTKKVLKQTHKYAIGSLQFGLLQLFFALASVIIVINVVLNYVQVDSLIETAQTTSNSFQQIMMLFVTVFKSLYEKIHFPGITVVITILGLLGLFALDRFVLQPRFRTMP